MLPRPNPRFDGEIGLRAKDSKPDVPQPVHAPIRVSLDEGTDVGEDCGTPVNRDYDVPFRFGGDLEKVVIHLEEK